MTLLGLARTTLLVLAAFALALPACSSDEVDDATAAPVVPPAIDASAADASTPDVAPRVVPKPTFPEVQSRGGAVIAAPKVVPIVFDGDPLAAQISAFTSAIATSSYWRDLGQEYGVGAMTARATIVVNETAPAKVGSSDIQTWLSAKLSGPSPAFGAPDPSTLYAVYYRAGTTVMMDRLGSELGGRCQGYEGSHGEMTVGGVQIAYAVLPRCSGIDDLTVAASHEYFEWATNPFPDTSPAYTRLDAAHWAWQAAFVGELGELCTYVDRDTIRPTELGFQVQTMWSNKASLAGTFPCMPRAGMPYVQAIPTAEDVAVVPSLVPNVPDVTTKAIRIPAGQSRTVDVLLYSDQPRSEVVPLRALTLTELTTGQPDDPSVKGYSYAVEPAFGRVGETVSITITAPSTTKYDLVVMRAQTAETSFTYWPTLVVNDAAPAQR